jgi:kynurenine formamidase
LTSNKTKTKTNKSMPKSMTIQWQGKTYCLELDKATPIGIPLRAGGQNPNCYWAEPPRFETIRVGDFVGSVAEGGSCNYQKVTLTPHGNGTHTECYGHICDDPQATIARCLQAGWWVALLVSLEPEKQASGDRVLTLSALKASINKLPLTDFEALVIRTLPNTAEKMTKNYNNTNPPYLEPALAEWCARQGIRHLLVDLPSLDREEDGGKLLAHKAFWQYPQAIRPHATVTELIYVPDALPDGLYALQLMAPFWETDAVPSTPVLFPLKEIEV